MSVVLTAGGRPARAVLACAAVGVLGLSGCSAEASTPIGVTPFSGPVVTVAPESESPSGESPSSIAVTSSQPAPRTTASSTSSSEALPPASTATAAPPNSDYTPPPNSDYTPPPDAQPVDGDCPYLDGDQVAFDTGQHIGPQQVIPGDPQPACIFVRQDGGELATVRALSFGTAAEAARAVDFYAPRADSSIETKPPGWTGGSLRTGDGGSIYAVSKDGYAVIASCNVMTVAARQLVVHAIERLGW